MFIIDKNNFSQKGKNMKKLYLTQVATLNNF
jgi:hypothetical protein